MPFKVRTEPKELQIIRVLDARMKLTADEKQHYLNLKKGYEGEVKFDSLTTSLDSQFYVLNDLLLESNNTTFQIDTLLITQEVLIPCEIKNFEGDYFYQNDNFHLCHSKKEITNPLHQFIRIETLLRQYLQKHGFPFQIKGNLIFINPTFFLYQAPLNEKIVFHPQLTSYLNGLRKKNPKLNDHHFKLAEHLVKAHITDPPFNRIPDYQFGELRKGIICGVCQSFQLTFQGRSIVCKNCGMLESIEDAVMRSVREFKMLFPDGKITTNDIYEWCRIIHPKKAIGRILKKNCKTVGYGQWTYYDF